MIGTRVTSSRAALLGLVSTLSIAATILPADAANKVLKIGFVGVTSGPAAAWGTSNVRSMQTLADWWNSKGGAGRSYARTDHVYPPFTVASLAR